MTSYMIFDQSPEEEKLYETCLKGSREDIRSYCQNGSLSSQYLRDGLNPMHVVAIAGRKDAEVILDMMLQNGFDVNSQTRSGEDTVLHLVIEHIDVKEAFPLVLKILEYRPDLSLRNRKLRTPYDLALAKGEFELAEVLEGTMTAAQAREFYTQKIGTLYGDSSNTSKTCSEHPTKPDDDNGATIHRSREAKLVDAVVSSREQDMKEFLNLGADPNYVNEHKNGAIHYAITHCKITPHKTLALLIQAGADVNLQDDEGDTALNLVIKSARLRESGEMKRCVELLVQHGAMSTFKDLDGYDALTLAKRREYTDIVALLQNNRQRDIQDPLPSFTETHDDFVHPPIPPPSQTPGGAFSLLLLPETDRDHDDVTPEPEPETAERQRSELESSQGVTPRAPSQRNITPRAPSQHNITPRLGASSTPRPSVTDPSPTPGPSFNPPAPSANRLQSIPQSPPPPFPLNGEYADDDDDFTHPIPGGHMNEHDMSQAPEVPPETPETPVDTETPEMALIRATRQGTVDDVNNAIHVLRAETNIPDETGIYPIHHVCIRGEFEDENDRLAMLQMLYDAGTELNTQTVNSESTALHVAATNNQDHVAKWLLDTHKCDYTIKNKEGLTAYEVAEQEECQEVMEVIDKHRQAIRDRVKKTAKASTCTLL